MHIIIFFLIVNRIGLDFFNRKRHFLDYFNRIINNYLNFTFQNNFLMVDRSVPWQEPLTRWWAISSSGIAQDLTVTNDANPHFIGTALKSNNGWHFDPRKWTANKNFFNMQCFEILFVFFSCLAEIVGNFFFEQEVPNILADENIFSSPLSPMGKPSIILLPIFCYTNYRWR